MENETFGNQNHYKDSSFYNGLNDRYVGELNKYLDEVAKITQNGDVKEVLNRVDELLAYVNNQETQDVAKNKVVLEHAVYKFLPILNTKDIDEVKKELDSENYLIIKTHLQEIPSKFDQKDECYGEIAAICKFGYTQVIFPSNKVIDSELL